MAQLGHSSMLRIIYYIEGANIWSFFREILMRLLPFVYLLEKTAPASYLQVSV